FNNAFMNYRKDILSVRVGATVLWEDNMFAMNEALRVKSTLEAELNEMQGILIRDIRSGTNFRSEGIYLWGADSACNLMAETKIPVSESSGSVSNLAQQYNQTSRDMISDYHLPAGQELMDYISATAGHSGQIPFNSPLGYEPLYVLGLGKVPCQ